MARRETLTLIEALARDEAALRGREFLAPLLVPGRVRLRLRDLIYELAVTGATSGWWICRMLDAYHAQVICDALPWQRGDYLALWPALRLVLLEPLKRDAWLALPYNPADAVQRFRFAGPLVVFLVEGGQPFERVIGRVEGSTIWYDDRDRCADPRVAEALRAALAAGQSEPHVPHVGAGERAAYTLLVQRQAGQQAAAEAARTAQRLRHALEVGGARLLGYETSEAGLRVTWERNGQRSVTVIDADLNVVSAGVCLSGEEERFDLPSIVRVVQDAPDYARWQLE